MVLWKKSNTIPKTMELRFTKGKHGRLPKEKNNETLIFNEQTMLILKQLKFLTSLRTLIYGTMENARYHGKKLRYYIENYGTLIL